MCVDLSWSDRAQTIVKGVEALSEMYLSKEKKNPFLFPIETSDLGLLYHDFILRMCDPLALSWTMG